MSTRLLTVAAICVPLFLLAVVALLSYRQVEAEAAQRAQRSVQALTEHALRTLRAHELVMAAVEEFTADMSWAEIAGSTRVHEFLVRLARGAEDVNTVFMIDPSGTNGASSLRFPLAPIDVRDRPFFTAARDTEGLHISAPDVGRLNQLRFFSLSRRKAGRGPGFEGIVSVSVNPAYFEQFFATMTETPRDAIALLRADGTVLARIPSAHQAQAVVPDNDGVRAAMAVSPRAGVVVAPSPLDGIARIHAYAQVGPYPVYAVYGLAQEAVWAAWRRSLAAYGVLALVAMALLLGAARLVGERTRREALAAQRYAHEAARRAAAEQASRAKDEFLATLSHELRNPLSAIAASAEVLQHAQLPAAAREPIGIIRRQAEHLKRLLQDLLDVARTVYGKVTLELRSLELVEFAREVATGWAGAASRQVELDVSGERCRVRADPTRLRQMIENLLDNAHKFGGRRIALAVAAAGGYARLSVRDDGEGIDAELLGRLFEPFVQGGQSIERSRGGLGLGLALVQGLAREHGGLVEAHSAGRGAGSCFTIVLPLAREKDEGKEADATAPALVHGAGLRPLRVLLVEDHPDARESLQALLELDGHAVQTAADGKDGLARFETFQPEVVLVDIGLPGMDGYEWARRVRARPGAAGVLLVALTGYGREADRAKAAAAGFDHHLTKPVSYAELAATLARATPLLRRTA